MDDVILSDGLRLGAHFARPNGLARVRGLVLCHGFPSGPRGSATSGATYPELADRVARATGFAALCFNFRGAGSSEGDFSVEGWLDDIRAAIEALEGRTDVSGVWLAGSDVGGSLALCYAAGDDRIRGVAAFGAYASLREWARDPTRLIEYLRRQGLIKDPEFPPDVARWARQFQDLDPMASAAKLAPRPLLVLHGADDDVVPIAQARALAKVGGPTAELRVMHAAGHRLRHDPRAVAALLGWLTRQLA